MADGNYSDKITLDTSSAESALNSLATIVKRFAAGLQDSKLSADQQAKALGQLALAANRTSTGFKSIADAQSKAQKAAEAQTKALKDQESQYNKLAAAASKIRYSEASGKLTTDAALKGGSIVNGGQYQRAFKNFVNTGQKNDAAAQAKSIDQQTEATKRLDAAVLSLVGAEGKLSASQDALDYSKRVAEVGRITAAQERYNAAIRAQAVAQSAYNSLRAKNDTSSGGVALEASAASKLAAANDEVRRSMAGVASAVQAQQGELPRLRYALSDVAQYATGAGVALTGLAAIPVAGAISWQKQLAEVGRTTISAKYGTDQYDAALNSVDKTLRSIGQTTPASLTDITGIATLAGQLGIAQAQMEDFTRTTIQFSATTDVSTEDAATAFGRLNALLPDMKGNYEGVASAILKTGINSVATESSIVSITSQLASVASIAGLTTDQVIGLSSATASLGISPELARGTFTRLFSKINDAVNEGGKTLAGFAAISGESADAFAQKWKTDAAGALVDFFAGLRNQGSQGQAALASIGITASRDQPTLLKYATGVDTVTTALADAKAGMEDTSTLTDQYGAISETVSAKLQIASNNIKLLASAIGGATTGPLAGFLDIVNKVLSSLTTLANHPWAQAFGLVATTAVGATGALGLLGGAIIRAQVGMLALRTAFAETGAAASGAARGGFAQYMASLTGVGAKSGAAATAVAASGKKTSGMMGLLGSVFMRSGGAVKGFARVLRSVGKVSGPAILITTLISLFLDFKGTIGDVANVLIWFAKVAVNVAAAVVTGFGTMVSWIGRAANAMGGFWGAGDVLESWGASIKNAGAATRGATGWLDGLSASINNWSGRASNSADATDSLGGAVGDLADYSDDAATGVGNAADQTGNLGDAASGASGDIDNLSREIDKYNKLLDEQQAILDKAIRTTKDFASDVYGIWSSAFTDATDAVVKQKAISDGWDAITKAANDAASAMDDANAKILDITADKSILEYQLRVAETYGDELRAAKIRAELAEKSNDLAKAQGDLAKASKDANSATDDSTIIDMASKYGNLAQVLLNAGYTGGELSASLSDLVSDFRKNATAAGFSADQVGRFSTYLSSFNQVAKSIPPADVTFGLRYGSNWFPTVSSFKNTIDNEIGSWAIQNKDMLLEVGWRMPDGSSQSLKDYWNSQIAAFNEKNRLQAIIEILEERQNNTQGYSGGGAGGGVGGAGGGVGRGVGGGAGAGSGAELDTGDDTADTGWNSFFDNMGSWWGSLVTNISTWWNGLVNNVGTWWNGLIGGIQEWWNSKIGGPISDWWGGFTGIIDEQIIQPWSAFFAMLDRIWNQVIVPAWQLVTGWIRDTWNTYVATPFSNVISWIGNAWNTYVATPFSNVISWIGNAWNTYVATPFNNVISWIGNAWNTYVAQPFQRISAAIKWAWDTYVAQPFGRVVSTVEWAWNTYVVNPFNRVSAAIQSTWDWAVSAIANFNPGRFFTNLWNSVLPGKATGGAVSGPGTGTSDTAGLYRLSNGEHVLTAADVRAMGGQSAVYAMRRALHNGVSAPMVPRGQRAYANGGAVRSAPVSSGATVVELGPASIHALATRVIELSVDGRALASAVTATNRRENAIGGAY